MKVLVIGSGGREHALCYSFKHDPRVTQLYCASGNAGIAGIAECVPIRPDDISSLADFAAMNAIDLTFVGGEIPLALGIVDLFESRGLKIIGPCREASMLESSKSFAKDFMARKGVPTAKFTTSHSPAFAILELESGDFGGIDSPVVVKADGLAAGKGVVVAKDRADAVEAINEMAALVGTAAAEKIILEECLFGREVSLLMFVDGEQFVLMPPVRDHKRIGEGDTGPNTGGMGTITDESLLSADELQVIKDRIIRPTLHGCEREGFRYRGILFLGLMMTADGPKLLEYNVRFGDPETQAILVRLETSLVDICEAMLSGDLDSITIDWRPGASACVVLAAEGYPSKPTTGDVIRGIDEAGSIAGIEVFHAGTSFAHLSGETTAAEPSLVTSGGRVVGVTASGNDLAAAVATAYSAVEKISFDGMQYRKDIGN
ncbi:MAG: phosphoribosylamine--glycine ligase [Acidobacteriota bacterium]